MRLPKPNQHLRKILDALNLSATPESQLSIRRVFLNRSEVRTQEGFSLKNEDVVPWKKG